MHVVWVVALTCACFVAGVALVLLVRLPWWMGFFGASLVALGMAMRTVWSLVFSITGALLLGLGYGSAHAVTRDAYRMYIGRSVIVSGRVKEDISKGTAGKYSIQLDEVSADGLALPGTLLVTTRDSVDAKRGDRLEVEGLAKEGFGSFPATISSAELRSVHTIKGGDVGREVRDWFADAVRRHIPEPQASLGVGFLTGQKSALSEDLSESLKIAGLTHIVVASGYNLTVLVRLTRKLFRKVSKYVSTVAAVAMVGMFMAIAGLSPSMSRAGLVSGLSLLAWYYGHTFHPFALLPLAAAVTVVLQPSYAWGDLGWQLSFAAFTGVMIVGPLITTYFFGEKEPGFIAQSLIETVAAHAVTVPIIALSFGTVSNVAIVANLLVVPLVPIAMLLTFMSGVCSLLGLGTSWLIDAPTTWLLGYMVSVADFVASMSWAQSTVSKEGWLWGGYAVVLVLLCWWMWRATSYDFRGDEARI